MGLFDRLFGRKNNVDSRAYKREQAGRLSGMLIKYVTERDENCCDNVIGHGGNISVRNDELMVFASSDIIFRADVDSLNISYLMSGDGVILSGPNKADEGREHTIIAHFVYHRK